MNIPDALLLNCGMHDQRTATVVCKHMLSSEPAPSGFIENSSDPDDLQAWCHLCEDKFEVEGGMTDAFLTFNEMALVCIDCYIEAKARHSLPSN